MGTEQIVEQIQIETQESKPQNPILVQYILDRVLNKNKNFIMVFCGATGSGKSYSALRLAELLDKTFTIDRVVFRAKDFMQLINKLVSENAPAGTTILWDETGVELNSREFMSISNRVLNYFFQTCRHLNFILILSVPVLSFLDVVSRKLTHCVAETIGINSKTKQCSLKIKMVQTNVITDKVYLKYLRYTKDKRVYVCKRIKANLPGELLRLAYEKKKREFTQALNESIFEQLEKVEYDKKRKQAVQKPLTEIQQQVLDCIRQGTTRQEDIAKKLGKTQSSISICVNYIRKKGYNI